jgi:tetratricopeptide (TPR) repeat protein
MTMLASPSLSAEHPFPGLRPFSWLDHAYFFGRKDQVFALYRLIDRSRFVAVVGGSGSGKSSLVRAGLLPLLDSEARPGGGAKWRIVEMRPGDAPLRHLADALANLAKDEDDAVKSVRRERISFALRDSTNGIEEALDEIGTPDNRSLLLLVDQFEELFRYGGGRGQNPREEARQRDEANDFVQLLLQARSIPERDVHVVLTMRSDFIGDCARFQGLPEAVSATQFLVPSLTRDQLEEVIRGPIERAGASIEPALVNMLVNDSGNDPDHLPVLQHCLLRMWNRAGAEPVPEASSIDASANRTLTVDHYNAIGRIGEALSRHADEILNDLKGHELAVEQMFRALADVDKEGRATRRALKFSQLVAETGVPPDELRLAVDRYRADDCSFLVPSISVAPELTPERPIDVGHEALLRGWTRVSGIPDAPQDDAPESIKARGWIRAEERDGIDYKGLVARIDDGVLPLRRFDRRLKWWQSRPRTPAWGKRYGGRFDEVERLFENTVRKKTRNARYLIGSAAAAIVAAVVSGVLINQMVDQRHAMHLASEASKKEAEAHAKRADENFTLVGRTSKALLEEIHRALRSNSMPMPMRAGNHMTAIIEKNLEEAKRGTDNPSLVALEAELALVSSDIALTLHQRSKAHEKAVAAKELASQLLDKKVAPKELAAYRYLYYRSAFRAGDLTTRATQAQNYRDAAEALAKLIQDAPGQVDHEHQLVFMGGKVGEALELQEKYAEALDYLISVRKDAEAFAAKWPGNHETQRLFAATLTKICKVRTEISPPDFEGGLAECDAAMEVQKKLVAMKLPDFAPTTNLAITHKVKADLLVQRSETDKKQEGDVKLALEEYQESIKIKEYFAARDLSDMRWPRDLAPTYANYGAALEKWGDLPRAVEQYQKEAEARKVLADANPTDETLQWQRAESENKLKAKLAAVQSQASDLTGGVAPR